MRRLVLCFDGTWNQPEDNTNPWRTDLRVAARDKDGNEQLVYYDEGVGAHWHDWLTGGAFGRGLSKNIQQGYQWLLRNYETNDEIFVFGFSRGAYTARSLVGFLGKCGLLRPDVPKSMIDAYEFYRNRAIRSGSPEAKAFRAAYSRAIRVRFLGVWDTVGALGIPAPRIPFSRDRYRFHDTELCSIVDHAYHALAIDEHREIFQPTLWTAKPEEVRKVQQRWFIGAHANVGGGYKEDPLPLIPLKWLHDKASTECGLCFKEEFQVPADAHRARIRDSFAEFGFHAYQLFKLFRRYHRPIGQTLEEKVDESVLLRRQQDEHYRPPRLEEYLSTGGEAPDAVTEPTP